MGSPACGTLLLTLATIISGPFPAASVSDISQSASSILSDVCKPGTCRNGQCYVRGTRALCYCHVMFHGSRCELVNIDQITYTVVGSMVIVQWPHPPRLQGYSFVYYELDDPNSFLHRRDIIMKDGEKAALVGNLKGSHTTYRICIEDTLIADRVITQNAMQYLSNCINLTTQPDYHTLAGWCIAAMLVCVAMLLIYWQKDKFELLYFSKPAFLMYEHEHEDKEEEDS